MIPYANKAQSPCNDDYFIIDYATPTAKYNFSSATNAQKELMLSGHVLRGGSLLRHGWLTKLSAQGTVLWSKDYNFSFYPAAEFRKVIDAGNGNWLAGGITGLFDTIANGFGYVIPFIIKVDQYGNKIWARYLDKAGLPNLEINNLLQLADGTYLVYMASFEGSLLLKLDANGNTVWSSGLYTAYFPRVPTFIPALYRYFDNRCPVAATQLRNGSIVLAKNIAYRNPDNPAALLVTGFELVALNNSNGDTLWRKMYVHNDSLLRPTRPTADFKAITELPNGSLSMISSFAYDAQFDVPFNSHALQIITNADGKMQSATAYSTSSPVLYCTDAVYAADGSCSLMMDNAGTPMMLSLAANGQIQWSYSYPYKPSLGTNTLVSNTNGNYIFFSIQNGPNKQLYLVKTNTEGRADCVGQGLNFTATDVTNLYNAGNQKKVPVKLDRQPGDNFEAPPTTTVIRPYTVTAQNTCRLTCCRDTAMPTIDIDLCNGKSYLLPNNYTVRESGLYPIVLKGSKGCDSIVPYRVSFSQPATVSLGFNQCFDGRDTIVLQTKSGYLRYNWLGVVSDNPNYSVTKPGKYWVSVTNACGTNSDTVEIFNQCEFDIYMPNAFTPNGDWLNDTWGVSPVNKNRLVRLAVYNRWGQKLFETNNSRLYWDGSFKGQPQETGVYLYELQMITLNGKPRNAKGTVLLVR